MNRRHRPIGHRALLGALLFNVAVWSPLWAADPPAVAPPAGEAGRARSFQISFGADWLFAEAVGTAAASMTTNASGGGSTTFFSNEVKRTGAPAFRARVGYRLTRTLSIEGGILVGRGTVEDTTSGDADRAPAATIAGSMTQYVMDVSVVARFPHRALAGGAAVLFVEAGGGYLRQLHEGNAAIDTGQIFHAGSGVTYMFARRQGSPAGLGLRADWQLYVRRKGFSVGDSTVGLFVATGAGLVVAF